MITDQERTPVAEFDLLIRNSDELLEGDLSGKGPRLVHANILLGASRDLEGARILGFPLSS
jgi:hypothetical protein